MSNSDYTVRMFKGDLGFDFDCSKGVVNSKDIPTYKNMAEAVRANEQKKIEEFVAKNKVKAEERPLPIGNAKARREWDKLGRPERKEIVTIEYFEKVMTFAVDTDGDGNDVFRKTGRGRAPSDEIRVQFVLKASWHKVIQAGDILTKDDILFMEQNEAPEIDE